MWNPRGSIRLWAGTEFAGSDAHTYNDAGEVATMSDNTGDPVTPTQWSQVTSYTYTNGQLASTTDGNNQTTSYLYNDDGQVACVAYPVASGSSCGSRLIRRRGHTRTRLSPAPTTRAVVSAP